MLHGLECLLDAAIAAQLVVLGLFARAEDALCVVLHGQFRLRRRRLQREVGHRRCFGGEVGVGRLRVFDGAQALLEALDAADLVVGGLGAGADDARGRGCGDKRHVWCGGLGGRGALRVKRGSGGKR